MSESFGNQFSNQFASQFASQFPEEKLRELWSGTKLSPGTLYVVGTPIGNMGDISIRALSTLAQADLVLAEDTRTSTDLLAPFNIHPKYLSFHQHNYKSRLDLVKDVLLKGKTVAQISDAGMPSVSDPGAELVDFCLDTGIAVKVVPGPTAVTSIVSLSGLDVSDFRFVGFLPQKEKLKQDLLADIKKYRGVTVLYEAPHRLLKTLEDLRSLDMGERTLVVGRELSKKYEEILRSSLDEAIAHFEKNEPRGEFVLLLDKASQSEKQRQSQDEQTNLKNIIATHMDQGDTARTILQDLSDFSALSKNDLKQLIREVEKEREENARTESK